MSLSIKRASLTANTKTLQKAIFILIITSLLASCSSKKIPERSPGSSQFDFRRAIVEEEVGRHQDLIGISSVADAHFYFMKGQIAMDLGNPFEALRFYEQAAKIDQSPAPLLRKELAQLYLQNGELEKALLQIDKALLEKDSREFLRIKAGILEILGNTEQAINLYNEIIEQTDSEVDEPYLLLANIYADEKRYEEARDVLQRSLEKRPESFFGHYYLARIYEIEGNLGKALNSYLEASKTSPKSRTVKLDIARLYGLNEQYDEAIRICEEILSKAPQYTKAVLLLNELRLKGEKTEDRESLRALNSLEEKYTDTRFKLGLIKLQRRALHEAKVDFSLILVKDPENSAARYYLGSTYAGLKRINAAVEQLSAIESDQKYFVESRGLAAYLLRQAERYDEAVSFLEELIDEEGEKLKYLTLLVNLQRDGKDYSSAIETQEDIIEKDPGKDGHYFMLGVLRDESGDKRGAISAMRKATEIDPTNANALNYLGYTMAELGTELEDAESLIKKAIELEPNNGFFLDSLGWVYYKQNKFKEAEVEFRKAVDLVPNDSVILEHYASTLDKLGRRTEALEILERALHYVDQAEDADVEGRIQVLLKKLKSQ